WRVRGEPLVVHPPQKKQEDAATDVGLALPLHKRSLRTEQASVMNPEEQMVTWLISMGALNSPKMMVEDPVKFLKTSLKDGVVLCKLLLRLLPGSIGKYCLEPKTEADCIGNIQQFLNGCAALKVEDKKFGQMLLLFWLAFESILSNGEIGFKGIWLLMQIDPGSSTRKPCSQLPSPAPGDCQPLTQAASARPSRVLQRQSRVREMTENGSHQLVVKARFQFKQTNEDELTINKGDIIYVTRTEEGGWWEGTLNGKTGWFPSNYVREIKSSDKLLSPKALKGAESPQLTKNYYAVVLQNILETEREYAKELQLPEHQQKVGGCFLSLMPQFASLYLTYCTNHPSAVNVLTQHSDELEKFMESQGMACSGILTLTTSLSKPFTRLDKYISLLQELERHMESQCQEMRKRKQLELQILSETIQGWEGEDIRSMGSVLYMSQAMVQPGGNEEKEERYLMLFPSVLLMLSASPCMSGFMYKGRLPLIGMMVTKLEDLEGSDHVFEISGSMGTLLTVHCSSSHDFHEWLDHLQRLTRGTPFSGTLSKTQSWGSHSTFSSTGQFRGPLEPPQILKPWTLSCLRPAPPLRPSVALSYKERMSYILKDASKSPKTMKKFLPKRKTERKPSDEEFVIRKRSRKDSVPQVLLPEEEKLITEEVRSNGQTVAEEKSLVDTVYALKDEVKELKQENKRMKQCLEEELKSRKDLEKLVRRLLKQTDESLREETGRRSSVLA
ncbi:hypothetical protein Chor_004707, partial [Crotalus horridus]